MSRQYLNSTVVLYVVAMAALIAGVDFLLFKNRFRERLTVNIGIVLVFAASTWDSSGAAEQGGPPARVIATELCNSPERKVSSLV